MNQAIRIVVLVRNFVLAVLIVNIEEIEVILNNLNLNKGAGSDGIPSIFLKNCSSSIAVPLCKLFQHSLNCGTFPEKLKHTLVFPIFKKGNATDILNYRPICILNSIEKVFERIVHLKLNLLISHLLTKNQHGFMKKRSTVTNLIEHTQEIAEALQDKKQTYVFYSDMSKAFDRVDHNRLIQKLHHIGISGTLLSWFKSYLYERSMEVVFNGSKSMPFTQISGVPQGSINGPFLFNIYINDVDSVVTSSISLYADDMKLKRSITDTNDCIMLQNDINSIVNYSEENLF